MACPGIRSDDRVPDDEVGTEARFKDEGVQRPGRFRIQQVGRCGQGHSKGDTIGRHACSTHECKEVEGFDAGSYAGEVSVPGDDIGTGHSVEQLAREVGGARLRVHAHEGVGNDGVSVETGGKNEAV